MAKQPKGELVVEQARTSAESLRQKVKRTTEDIIEIGSGLLATRAGLFERSGKRGYLHCISWVRHLQLRMCPGSRAHLLLHRCGSLPLPT